MSPPARRAGSASRSKGKTRGYIASNIEELVGQAATDGPLDAVAIDIPIGLPDKGRRKADELAKAAIGPRRSSVFIRPCGQLCWPLITRRLLQSTAS